MDGPGHIAGAVACGLVRPSRGTKLHPEVEENFTDRQHMPFKSHPYKSRSQDVAQRKGTGASATRSVYMLKLMHFLRDETGATAIEYGLIAAGISIAIITVVGTLGSQLNATFTTVSTALK
jgi:pilus assembly protein Flp/PilA